MKKAITFILALVMLLSLAACGGTKDTSSTTEPTQTKDPRPTDADLKRAANLINGTIEQLENIASIQLYWMDAIPEVVNYFFEDPETGLKKWGDDKNDHSYKELEYTAQHRKSIRRDLDTAKEIINNGEGDFYKAVKSFYVEANKFYNLVSKYPQGYSITSYSTAVNDCKSACQSAYSEVEFYL